jgi:hypothetical protein
MFVVYRRSLCKVRIAEKLKGLGLDSVKPERRGSNDIIW